MLLEALNIQSNKRKQLKKKGMETVEDLLWFFPRKYNDFRFDTGILPKEYKSCFTMRVENVSASYKATQYIEVSGIIVNTGQAVCVTWFNQMFRHKEIQGAYGKNIFVCGNASYNTYRQCPQIIAPDIFSALPNARGIYPVYSKVPGMSDEFLKSVMQRAFALLEQYMQEEVLPEEEIRKNNLLTRKEAFEKIHHPKSPEDIERAKERFAFEELLSFSVRNEWRDRCTSIGSPYQIKSLSLKNEIEQGLPFILTSGQKGCIEKMIALIREGKRLNALVQGDVGSGKSIIAFLMMIAISSSGYQSVIMAPTQVLAKQHYEDLRNLVGERLSVVYLGAELRAAEKKAVKEKIKTGEADIIVGTHSVISKDVEYQNLALCVIDEEHRFGVEQRQKLTEKASLGVHTIKLSATPIPRSLSEVVFGKNVQVFNIRTKPQGRIPVKTGIAVSRERIYRFIVSQVRKGHQIYVVCPMIDENENMEDVKSVSEITKEYTEALSPYGIRIATVTGKDAKTKSEEIITSFKSKAIDVLISTTVIEVGVNVPNATGIIICSADRFGLAQLHQLRGRVGRSSFDSYCVFEVENPSAKAKERLEILCNTNDGFEIAEADLKIRGGGDILGTAQSGLDRYIELIKENPALYEKAKETAMRLLDAPNECKFLREKVLLEKIENIRRNIDE